MSRRVIVCGGYKYGDGVTFSMVLNAVLEKDDVIVEGGQSGGTDFMARAYGALNDIVVDEFIADLAAYGGWAAVMCNREMLAAGADLVIAFPGGRTTQDMMDIAREAGVQVLRVVPIADGKFTLDSQQEDN